MHSSSHTSTRTSAASRPPRSPFAAWALFGPLFVALSLAVASPAQAASCWEVTSWTGSGRVGDLAVLIPATCTAARSGYAWGQVIGSAPQGPFYLLISLSDSHVSGWEFSPLLVLNQVLASGEPQVRLDLMPCIGCTNKVPLQYDPFTPHPPSGAARRRHPLGERVPDERVHGALPHGQRGQPPAELRFGLGGRHHRGRQCQHQLRFLPRGRQPVPLPRLVQHWARQLRRAAARLPSEGPNTTLRTALVRNPTCGDNACNGLETESSCPQDCDRCGNYSCSATETLYSCPQDCGWCGDGYCAPGESCSADCGSTCPGPYICETPVDM